MSQAAHAVGFGIPITSAAAPAVNHAVGRSHAAQQHAACLILCMWVPQDLAANWCHGAMAAPLIMSPYACESAHASISCMPAVRCEVRIPFQFHLSVSLCVSMLQLVWTIKDARSSNAS